MAKRKSRAATERPARDRDWAAFDALEDAEIEKAAATDPDAAPVAGDAFWRKARVVMPVPKKAISIRLDEDLLDWFKRTGPGYQSRINAVLRAYMEWRTPSGSDDK